MNGKKNLSISLIMKLLFRYFVSDFDGHF